MRTAPSHAPALSCSLSFFGGRLAGLLVRDRYTRWSLRAGAAESGMLGQLCDWALRRHILGRIEDAADTGRNLGRRELCSSSYGDSGLDRHAGSRQIRGGLTRIQTDAYGEPAYNLGEISGGIVRRDQCELGTRRRRDRLDVAA